ncbi:MAG TPA: hypothetical protein VGS79_06135 [Puia sp.]|nr:hypothetical protein [Puia sp.]
MDTKKIFFLLAFCLCCISMGVYAQDTTRRKTIDITSSFKPVLRDAVKIDFNAAPPALDTSRPRLSYNIPAQYLFLNYQPGEMKPVALQRDSINPWTNYNYIKVGAGNIHIPYVRTGFSFGDGKSTFINLFADELNSKGPQPFQKNSLTNIKATGTFKTPNNLEWNGGVGYKNDMYYLYGFQPDTLKFNGDQLKQDFQTFSGNISLRNTVPTEFGLLYHPNFKVSYFWDNHSPMGNEANSVLNLPLEKMIGKQFAFDLGVTADLTHYNLPSGNSAQNNNVYYVNPAFLVKTQNFFLQAAVTPSWDNKQFYLLPNFLADISTSDQRFTIQAGWIGYYDKGSYQRFESINPWLAQPDSLFNTRMQEFYGGFKGSLGKHFTYAAKVGILSYKNLPLFVNDYTNDGKDFVIRYEQSMQAAQFHGEVSYLQGDVLEVTGSINGLQFHDQKTWAKPWGMLPVEFNAHFKWQAFKDFWAKADVYTFQGAEYLAADGSSHRGGRGTDANAGVEFKITRALNLWFQMNNIFNNKYQRWNQYQVYGFNVLGGIVFTFGQK